MLYLISTPIGNLEDITFRAISTLKKCDYILCEDTRKSRVLLDHYDIKKKLVSFHKFKEKTEEDNIIKDLNDGKDIALISDAGTPVISDPGEYLIKRCIKEKIEYTHIPGPCSLISAYVVSGINAKKFQFIGFLPKKSSEKENFLKEAMYYPGATVCFDTPHRIIDTLKIIYNLDKKRNIFIAREITKKFEEFLSGTAKDLIEHFDKKEPKGEMVLVLSENEMPFDLLPEELIEMLIKYHNMSTKEAIKAASKIQNKSKNELYKLYCKKEKNK